METASPLQGDTAGRVNMRRNRNKGMLIGGVALVAEGTALTMYGARYLDFMERHGLMDVGKRLLNGHGEVLVAHARRVDDFRKNSGGSVERTWH